jgi:hypothetical protein
MTDIRSVADTGVGLASGGAERLSAPRVGHLFAVPRHGLEELVGGPITWPIATAEPAVDMPPAPVTAMDIRSG